LDTTLKEEEAKGLLADVEIGDQLSLPIGNGERGEIENLLLRVISLGHHSVLEHASFTFGIEGVSRAMTHQLVRHRVASYSQQSQRYVEFVEDLPRIVPESIKNNTMFNNQFEEHYKASFELYRSMCQSGIPAEDARYVLPSGTETKIIVTMNARELRHFFRIRCCRRAQWEIREVAEKMLRLVKVKAPALFADSGPSCICGPCPEGKLTCGEVNEVRIQYKEFHSL
jgi:thymidylate synthase (FAD)